MGKRHDSAYVGGRRVSFFWQSFEVLDYGERLVEVVQMGTPRLISIGLPKSDRVVVKVLRLDEQQVRAARFDRP